MKNDRKKRASFHVHPLLSMAGKSLRPIEIRDGELQDGRK